MLQLAYRKEFSMKTYTVSELKRSPNSVLNNAKAEQFTLITQNGKPKTLLFDIEGMDLEQVLIEARRYRSRIAINEMRKRSGELGNDSLTEDDIETIISATRKSL
jgi:hypothetical protein